MAKEFEIPGAVDHVPSKSHRKIRLPHQTRLTGPQGVVA